MQNAERWVHPTKFTGDYPDWNGFTFLDWHKKNNVYHPGDDYNFGYGNQDLGQDVVSTASGTIIHASRRTAGYGPIIIIKHNLGYNLRRFIKETYGIETTTLYSFYAHLKDIFVNEGDQVGEGQRIGTVGKGGTTWAHLHFEIYAPIGELAKKGWRFYPVGWAKETIKKYWLPAYRFIESVKNIETYETFLGKSKSYWLQVEEDRKDLMEQLGKEDIAMAKKLKTAYSESKQLEKDIAKMEKGHKKAITSVENNAKKLTKKITTLKETIKKIKTENTELLKENAEKLSLFSAIKIVVYTILSIPQGDKADNG